MNFLSITKQEAEILTQDITIKYSPCFNVKQEYFIFKESYDSSELPNTIELTDEQIDGLTPTDPTKPMFPKRDK